MMNDKVHKVMSEFKSGKLHMGKTGKIVPKHRRDIATAIALSEARKMGEMKSHPPKRYDNPEHEVHMKKGMIGYWDKIQQKIIYK